MAIDSAVLNATFSSLDKGILGVKRFHNLGAVCAAMGQHEGAQEWWSKALAEDPRAHASRQGLFQSSLATGKLEGARQLLEEMFTFEGPTENWAKAGGAYSRLVGGVSGEEGFYRHAIERGGRELGPRRVYARWLLEMGREA